MRFTQLVRRILAQVSLLLFLWDCLLPLPRPGSEVQAPPGRQLGVADFADSHIAR